MAQRLWRHTTAPLHVFCGLQLPSYWMATRVAQGNEFAHRWWSCTRNCMLHRFTKEIILLLCNGRKYSLYQRSVTLAG